MSYIVICSTSHPCSIYIKTTRPSTGCLTNFILCRPTVLCPQTAGVVVLRTTGRWLVTGHARTTAVAHDQINLARQKTLHGCYLCPLLLNKLLLVMGELEMTTIKKRYIYVLFA